MKIKLFCRTTLRTVLVTASLLILPIVVASAQSEHPAVAKIHSWDNSALAKVPAKSRVLRNPLEGDPDAVKAGGKLFEDHCSECHGKDARGGKRGPSLNCKAVQETPAGTLFFVLTNGVVRQGMPGWAKLPEPMRWQIVSFLRSLHE